MEIFGAIGTAVSTVSQVITAISGGTVGFFTKFMGVASKLVGFVGKILGPVFAIFEIGKDLVQSLGIFADDKQAAKAQSRLKAGAAGAAAGGVLGSVIPGLGTLMGALTGYSLAASTQGFSRGTNRMLQGGAALVGEKGPEIVTIPAGASVIPNNAFARGSGAFTDTAGAGSTRDVTVHVKLDVNDRKFKEMITLNTVDVIEGRNTVFA